MKKRLTYVNPWQIGKVAAAVYALLSVLMIPFFWLGSLAASHSHRPGVPFAFRLAFIVFPIFYIVFGYIFGVLTAAIYNLVAKWTGGIEFIVTEVPSAAEPPALPPSAY
jgi:hypothetical protein